MVDPLGWVTCKVGGYNMGIKTVFNPMGGVRQQGEPYPPLDEWRYIDDTTNDVRILQKYLGSATDIVVPYGHTVLNKFTYNNNPTVYDNVPFFNRRTITSVDLRNVPFVDGDMQSAFEQAYNLTNIYNMNNNITDLTATFDRCYSLNQNIRIPSSITSLNDTFNMCSSFNQNIQIPSSVVHMFHTFDKCVNLNQNIQIPNSVTDMQYTFANCTNLDQNVQISDGVVLMQSTFRNCASLNQNIQIPNSVTAMQYTFANCYNLNQNIQVSNNLASSGLGWTFSGCYNLNQNIQIPSGAKTLTNTFDRCYSLNQNIQIPSGATSMSGTFSNCTSLNQNIQIPNSVTSMYFTFRGCTNLNQGIQIPDSVTTMQSAFQRCTNLSSMIDVYSYDITCAANCFNGTSSTKFVRLPYRYINNTLSETHNAFNSAGYIVGTGVGNATINGCIMSDWVAGQGYPTYTGNGTHWVLGKWANSSAPTEITVPNQILGYPTAIANTCFAANSSIAKLDVSGVPVTSGTGTFENCHNLTLVKNLSQGEGTNYQGYFYNCQNLLAVTQDGSDLLTRTAHPYMPNTATSARAMYGHCKNIVNFYIDSYGVTTLYRTFNGVNTRAINVYINSPEVSNIAGTFTGYSSSYRKNIYIYFKYQNGVHTKTRNSFNVAVYKGSSYSENGPWYNTSSNFYVYNKGVCPI